MADIFDSLDNQKSDIFDSINVPEQKSLIPQLTSQEKMDHPVLAGVDQVANNVATLGYNAANGLSLGLLNGIMGANKVQPPAFNMDNMSQKDQSVLNLGGDIANLGGAGKSLGVIGGKIGDIINSTGVPKAISPTLNSAKNYIVDAFTGGEKAKNAGKAAKFALRQDVNAQTQGIVKNTMMQSDIQKASQQAIGQGYDDLSDTLKKMISKESDKQGLKLQDDLPKLFGKKSAEYGAEQDSIINNLPDEQKVISSDKVIQPMEDALKKYGILRTEPSGQVVMARAPLTPAENQIFGMYENQKKFSTIDVGDLIKTQKYIQPQFGKSFSPDDKLLADVSKGLGKTISDHVPAIKELNKSYAPFLEWKNATIDKIQPFNSQYDVSTGLLSKAGSKAVSPGDQRLLAGLRQNMGNSVEGKIPALQKGLASIPEKKALAQQQSQDIIDKVRSDAAKKIFKLRQNKAVGINDIDKSVSDLIHTYNMRKLKLAIGGGVVGLSTGAIGKNALQYFFRREVYSGINQ